MVETSASLTPWTPAAAAAVLTAQSRTGDVVTRTWRSAVPLSEQPWQFLRLKVQQKP